MALAPFGMTGIPGSNFGGSNTPAPAPTNTGSGDSTTLGSASATPFLPQFPGGTTMPGTTDPMSLAGGQGGYNSATNFWTLPLMQQWQQSGGSKYGVVNYGNLAKGFNEAGYKQGVGAALAQFLMTGAGFNPQVAEAMINAMAPHQAEQQAQLMEQFSNMGLRGGSPAAIGLADFLSQVNLNQQQIWAQLYEQSVQNYMNVLLSGAKKPGPGAAQSFATFAQGLASLAGMGHAQNSSGSISIGG